MFFSGCIKRKQDFSLAQHPDTSKSGWQNLLADDLSNCVSVPEDWSMDNGVLALSAEHPRGHRLDIWTKDVYGDFILDFEFKFAEKVNSGVFIRTANIKNPVQTGIEMQIKDTHGMPLDKKFCGAIYDCLAPAKDVVKPAGEWNRATIACKANKIFVVMNGKQIINMDLNRWKKAGKNPDGTKNKFKNAIADFQRFGHIGFQDHGGRVWYRNIKIKKLGH